MNERCRKLFSNSKVDMIVLKKQSNLAYFCGYENGDSFIVISSDTAYYVTDSRYAEKAETSLTDFTVLSVSDKVKSINELICNSSKIGIEKSLTVSLYLNFKSAKSVDKNIKKKFTFIDGETAKLRNIKTEQEICYIKKAIEVAEEGLKLSLPKLYTGITEKEFCRILENNMLELGADSTSFETIIAFGENSSLPHHRTGDRALREGEPILIDYGAKINGYCSDITRTIFYGSLDSEFETVYNIVREANEIALENIRAGVICKKVDLVVREFIDSTKYSGTFIHSLGHGIGLDIHEFPILNSDYPEKLENGNVVTDEPGIYLKGKFGVRIEDDILVEDGIGKRLTTLTRDLIKIEIRNY